MDFLGGRKASQRSVPIRKEVIHMWMIIAWLMAFVFLCVYLFGTDDKHGPF